MYNYDKLRGKIKEHFGTLEKFSSSLGIGISTLNSRLSENTYFNQKEIAKCIELLHLTDDETREIFFEN